MNNSFKGRIKSAKIHDHPLSDNEILDLVRNKNMKEIKIEKRYSDDGTEYYDYNIKMEDGSGVLSSCDSLEQAIGLVYAEASNLKLRNIKMRWRSMYTEESKVIDKLFKRKIIIFLCC